MDDFSNKINVLKKIYALFHDAVDTSGLVCREKCASCCTCNVTLTSLEARFILSSLGSLEKKELWKRIEVRFPEKRYIPKMTTNMFAKMCMEEDKIPEEENNPAFGICPLLENDLCTIYEVRPFGCRALMSDIHCLKKGYARLPPWVLTLNTLFLQVIEHLDQDGMSGNLSDLLILFLSGKAPANWTGHPGDICSEKFFVCNQKIPVLMVPPEHQEKLKGLIGKLAFFLAG